MRTLGFLILVGFLAAPLAFEHLARVWPLESPMSPKTVTALVVFVLSALVVIFGGPVFLFLHIREAERQKGGVGKQGWQNALEAAGGLIGFFAVIGVAYTFRPAPDELALVFAVAFASAVVHWWLGGRIGARLDRAREDETPTISHSPHDSAYNRESPDIRAQGKR